MKAQVLALGLLLLTAGCLGGDDGGDETGDGVEPQDADGDGEPDAADAPAPEEPAGTWSSTTFEGSFTSVNIPGVGALNPSNDASTFSGSFDVAEGALLLVLNVTGEGGDFEALVAAPDCSPDITNPCEERVASAGGVVEFAVEAPDAGSWGFRLFATAAGPSTITWSAVASTLVGAAPPVEE